MQLDFSFYSHKLVRSVKLAGFTVEVDKNVNEDIASTRPIRPNSRTWKMSAMLRREDS